MVLTRRGFLEGFAATAAVVQAAHAEDAAASTNTTTAVSTEGVGIAPPKIDHAAVPPRNRNPYSDVDWSTVQRIHTTTHGHCTSMAHFAEYMKHDFGFFTISNYYPSAPTWPAAEMRLPRGLPVTDWPVVYKGRRTAGPFDWNKIVAEWLPPTKNGAPFFRTGAKMFPDWPTGMLEAPNAEHHSFLLADGKPCGALHICAPGSAYASGTFDAHNKRGTKAHGYHFGSGEFWGTAIDRMIEKLIVPDGGGVTINHPSWSHLDRKFLLELLDWDPRVLGIEVLEHGFNSEHYWDWVLATGRQCYGTFVPDWGYAEHDHFGLNVLLVPERTVEACLRAYRKGNWYGALRGFGELKFTKLAFDGDTVQAATDKPAKFEFKTARGVVSTQEGTEASWSLPKTRKGRKSRTVETFVRVKAYAADGSGEILFSQAFMAD